MYVGSCSCCKMETLLWPSDTGKWPRREDVKLEIPWYCYTCYGPNTRQGGGRCPCRG